MPYRIIKKMYGKIKNFFKYNAEYLSEYLKLYDIILITGRL
jgi:hypothetical protein